jgi:hypothetical protein
MRRAGGRGALPALFRIQSAYFFQVAYRYPLNLMNSITTYSSGYRINEGISFFGAFKPSTQPSTCQVLKYRGIIRLR